jgi:GNAT superfamily N-acetyltransferase
MVGTTPAFILREAEIGDAAEIARLGTELGYPADNDLMLPRLQSALDDGSRRVFVAAAGGGLLGWICVERRSTLETGDKAEIVGLVIDARARRLGVGQTLTEAAEDWARQQGFDSLMVRSNAARIESHPFYLKHGYRLRKTQQVYSKPL